ncbi:class II fructose-1,6-bisphosphate aldolase [Mycoplasmopsis agassizii]|uniref:Fructose-1,6-bisphosphate aldolase, class II n=1 Tax=Mycoplasmopsis agassizii TaxID=33922 RepID=A0ABX4H5R1_9BACT|nr:class II fructose-1,6-bisphosphate aldolase [Mycoplasmopsis agassizii]PAF55240.1 fructose-1,6-bisphosphate aldolase, class II [Mycoplasmopsis agassizii]SMC15659.1 fructose-bisphosphate aldolase, class II [Mycoplasmopsis agassizii]
MSKLVSASKMLKAAEQGKYAIPHININNLEWTKAALLAAQKNNSPIMLATSEGAVKYMGGVKTVVALVSALVEDLKISVPVALHFDHGSYEGVKKAIEAGYTSVMYDGSHEEFATNIKNTKELITLAKAKGVSFEAEVGTIGGEEDGIVGNGDLADPEEAKTIAALGIDVLAAGIGNIHGPYPASWKSLNFERLEMIKKAAGVGIVLHGGSGIPKEQIQKAISLGVAKINVNTELQLANASAIKDFVISGKIDQGKNFDPRKIYAPGIEAMINTVTEKMQEFGSVNKA